MLNIKWCLVTGALMLCAVVFTHMQSESSQVPPGVTTRWWDGSVQSVNSSFPNGKPQLRIEYAEDGKTELLRREWNSNGMLMIEKVRLPDGKVEEKEWYNDGKVLAHQIIWVTEGKSFQSKLNFHTNGNKSGEEIRTEDGQSALSRKFFDESGTITSSYEVLPNADQREVEYSEGKMVQESILRGTGDVVYSIFRDNENLVNRSTRFKLDKRLIEEFFGNSGRPLYTKEVFPETGESIVSVFKEGRLLFKQHFKSGNLSEVTEYTGGKTIARVIKLARDGSAEIRALRFDGTLQTVKEYNPKREVTRTLNYATNGTTLESEHAGGTPDIFDNRLFSNINVQTLIEEDAK
mgnify:CR=1 FL=1